MKTDVLGKPSPEQAKGCVTCLGCLGWPIVFRMSTGIWTVWCNCSDRRPETGSTRAEAVEAWNKRNERIAI